MEKENSFELRMEERNFFDLVEDRASRENSRVCVGLDSEYAKLPKIVRRGVSVSDAIFKFNEEIVQATHDLVAAYKPNKAFYAMQGTEGVDALKRTVTFINERYPSIPVILDSKRGDIGNSNRAYLKGDFEEIGADAVTMHPYLGEESARDQLKKWRNKGFLVLCRTSNDGAEEFQDLKVGSDQIPFYQKVAKNVAEKWNLFDNMGLVVGATDPQSAAAVREVAPDLLHLVPGVGHQKGDLEQAVKASANDEGGEFIVNSSRSIIFPEVEEECDFANGARRKTERLKVHINDVVA